MSRADGTNWTEDDFDHEVIAQLRLIDDPVASRLAERMERAYEGVNTNGHDFAGLAGQR